MFLHFFIFLPGPPEDNEDDVDGDVNDGGDNNNDDDVDQDNDQDDYHYNCIQCSFPVGHPLLARTPPILAT